MNFSVLGQNHPIGTDWNSLSSTTEQGKNYSKQNTILGGRCLEVATVTGSGARQWPTLKGKVLR